LKNIGVGAQKNVIGRALAATLNLASAPLPPSEAHSLMFGNRASEHSALCPIFYLFLSPRSPERPWSIATSSSSPTSYADRSSFTASSIWRVFAGKHSASPDFKVFGFAWYKSAADLCSASGPAAAICCFLFGKWKVTYGSASLGWRSLAQGSQTRGPHVARDAFWEFSCKQDLSCLVYPSVCQRVNKFHLKERRDG